MRTKSFIAQKFTDKLLQWWRSSKVKPYIKPRMVVVDLGCGYEANLLNSVRMHIAKGYGFDLDVNSVAKTEKLVLATADLNQPLPLATESADIIISTAVIEHLDNYRGFTSEIFRILRPGGRAILTTPTRTAEPLIKFLALLNLIGEMDAKDHKRYFDNKQLVELFNKTGFDAVEVKKFQLGFNQLVIAVK